MRSSRCGALPEDSAARLIWRWLIRQAAQQESCSKRFQKAEEGGAVADDARLSIRFHFS